MDNKRLKILIVSQYFWPENFGINQLASNLLEKGALVEVLTGMPNYPKGVFFSGYGGIKCKIHVWQNIKIYRVPIIRRGESNNRLQLCFNYCSFILSGIFFSPFLLRNKKYDLIFVYGVSPIFQSLVAFWVGMIKKIPVVLWVQDLWPESVFETNAISSKFLLKPLEYAVRFCYQRSSYILVQSKGFLGSIKKLSSNKKIYFFPNSIDKSFYAETEKSAFNISSLKKGFTILFAGNIGSAQAIETILQAAFKLKTHKEIKFVFLGEGSNLNLLKSEILQSKLNNVYYEGAFPISKMPKILRQASILLVSLRNKDIFNLTIPNKIQAYLAAGRPIIGSINGEGAKLIKNAGAGTSVPAEDADALVRAIIHMYQLPKKQRNVMGANGRRYFKKHFDSNLLTNKLLNHFKLFKK